MRCCCCNNNLNDYESTLRGAKTGDFLDMCRKCLKDLNIETLPNKHQPEENTVEEEFWWDIYEQTNEIIGEDNE